MLMSYMQKAPLFSQYSRLLFGRAGLCCLVSLFNHAFVKCPLITITIIITMMMIIIIIIIMIMMIMII